MNWYVPPHRLVSVSAFEEDHPNSKGTFNVVVLARGSCDVPTNNRESILEPIYRWDILTGTQGWDEILHRAETSKVFEVRENCRLSTFNLTKDGDICDQQGLAVVSWSKTHEDMLADSDRGGCSCSIF